MLLELTDSFTLKILNNMTFSSGATTYRL